MYGEQKSEELPNSGTCSILNDFCPYIDANCEECGLHIWYQRTKEAVCRMYESWEKENEHDGK